jgi:hypothetical protein
VQARTRALACTSGVRARMASELRVEAGAVPHQGVAACRCRLPSSRPQSHPIVTRYAWPSELDLMARIAGLRLKERWDGWSRNPFTSTGNLHIRVRTLIGQISKSIHALAANRGFGTKTHPSAWRVRGTSGWSARD